jgi:hypothetical protein
MTAPSGKSFNGWRTEGQSHAAGASYTVTGNVTFTAEWGTTGGGGDTTTYTVAFDAGDGSGTVPVSQTVNSGQSITLPGQGSMTAPSGKSFNGWRTGGQNYGAGASYTVNGNVTFTAQWRTGGGGGTGNPDAEGVYIGIISFAGNASDLTGGTPILLNASGKSTLTSYLNNNYAISSAPGTALFYGVHRALANLKSNESHFPANLDSVNVITFTDGMDISSDGRSAFNPIENKTFDSPDEYADYVVTEIADRSILPAAPRATPQG